MLELGAADGWTVLSAPNRLVSAIPPTLLAFSGYTPPNRLLFTTGVPMGVPDRLPKGLLSGEKSELSLPAGLSRIGLPPGDASENGCMPLLGGVIGGWPEPPLGVA